MQIKTTEFGTIPRGFSFKFKGDNRVWFVGANRSAFTFKEDGNTKIERTGIAFGETVRVAVENGRITSFEEKQYSHYL